MSRRAPRRPTVDRAAVIFHYSSLTVSAKRVVIHRDDVLDVPTYAIPAAVTAERCEVARASSKIQNVLEKNLCHRGFRRNLGLPVRFGRQKLCHCHGMINVLYYTWGKRTPKE